MADNGKDQQATRVVIVGGGFAGISCARALAKHDDIHVTLIDKNDYHQFQPLLYQVATSMLAARDIAFPLRKIAAEFDGFEAHRREVASVDPAAKTVTTVSGDTYAGDYLVLAAGIPAELLQDPGRRARVSALLARRRGPPPDADHPGLRGGGSRQGPGGGRGPRLRRRRRRPDGRRGGRRPVRDDQHDDGLRVPRARAQGQGPPGRSRQGTAQDVRRQGPRRTRRGCSRRMAWTSGWDRASPRSARAT